MAFIRSNIKNNQYVASIRYTAQLDSAAGYCSVSLGFQGYPMPADAGDILWNAYAGSGTFPVQVMGPGSISGNYIGLSLFYSGTSASLAATASVILIAQWLIGSK